MEDERPIEVWLLTQGQCRFCVEAKELLAALAGELPLRVEEIELDSGRGRRLAAEGGVLFPPGIFIEGRPVSYGRPSRRRLRRELQRAVLGS